MNFFKNRMKKLAIVLSIEFLIAVVLIIGADWAGETIHRLFHSYYADIALPFGFYFLLVLVEEEQKWFRPWYSKALAVFLLCLTSEILQYFGIYALAIVFDPLDIVAYASGVLLAALLDIKVISKYYPKLHITYNPNP